MPPRTMGGKRDRQHGSMSIVNAKLSQREIRAYHSGKYAYYSFRVIQCSLVPRRRRQQVRTKCRPPLARLHSIRAYTVLKQSRAAQLFNQSLATFLQKWHPICLKIKKKT
jgi:hypothetical protein